MRTLAVLILAFVAQASAAPPQLTPQPFVSGLAAPVEITHAHDSSGRLFVVEQAGRIRVIRNGALLATPFIDLRSAVGGPVRSGGEQGLLGLAFHPAYAANGRFYVYYTRTLAGDANGSEIVVARYNRSAGNADVADVASASIVLVVQHPQQGNHNGGKIAFGPDGYLYIAIGDGGGGGDPFGAGQSLADMRGKIHRIDVDSASPYAIPATNPFASSVDPNVRKEIWAYGLRNPWRFSFDRASGDLFIGDVGQGAWEEIDLEPAGSGGGRNYGWSVMEGTHCYPPGVTTCATAGKVLPIVEYGHDSAGGISVTGGYMYRGGALPALSGYYVYGDYGSGHTWAARASESFVPTLVATLANLSTFGEDENGELYAANLSAGTMVRLTPAATTIPRLANISTRSQVLTGNDVLIGGFVIGGTTVKRVAIVATGPSLSGFGIANALANPTLTLVRSSDQSVVASNDDWQTAGNAAQLQAAGFAPSNPLESAILVDLAPGAYTAIVSGAGGGTGVGIVGVYEVTHPELPLINISSRARVLTGNDVMIGGFVVQGSSPRQVLVTATGPSLAAFGIAQPLANPTLTLVRSSDQVVMGTNDDWQSAANAAQIQATGLAPSQAMESAVMLTLAPGAYTAIVSGAGGGTGVAVVAVYSLQ